MGVDHAAEPTCPRRPRARAAARSPPRRTGPAIRGLRPAGSSSSPRAAHPNAVTGSSGPRWCPCTASYVVTLGRSSRPQSRRSLSRRGVSCPSNQVPSHRISPSARTPARRVSLESLRGQARRPLLLPQGRHARMHDAGLRDPRRVGRVRADAAPSSSASAPTTRGSHVEFKAEVRPPVHAARRSRSRHRGGVRRLGREVDRTARRSWASSARRS